MEFILEIIVEVIFFFMLRYPGVFIRWFYYRGQKEYRVLLQDEYANSIVSVVFICIIALAFVVCQKWV